MTLLDTSIWVDHFRRRNAALRDVLAAGEGGLHAFVIGELALGRMQDRHEVLDLLRVLPRLPTASDDEVHELIDRHDLAGSGIGWVDAHLLCAAKIYGWRLLTLDARLGHAAAVVGLAS